MTIPTRSARRSTDDCETDVLVIGAGIAGLSCAWHLAERGVDCTVVEARTAASGASGRNGGFLVAGAAPAHQDAVRLFGHEVALGIYRATLASEQRIYEIADEIGAERALRARGLPARHLGAGRAGARARPVRGDARRRPPGRMGRRGRSARDRAAARARRRVLAARRDDAPGALGAGVLARDRGARRAHLRAQPRARAARRGAQRRLRGARRRRHGARAARGGGGGRRTAAARALLRAERAHEAPAHGRHGTASPSASCPARSARAGATSTCSSGPTAASPRAGSRISDGERAADSYTTAEEPSPAVHARIERFLRDDLGIDAPVTHRWVGLVGYSRDERAFVGAVPGHDGLFVAGGYNGTGNLNGFTAGRIISELLATGRAPTRICTTRRARCVTG